jgi:hypothetical protein
MSKISITVIKASLTRDVCTFSAMDPYFLANHLGKEYKSKVLNSAGKNPTWNESFGFDITPKDYISIDILHDKEKVKIYV